VIPLSSIAVTPPSHPDLGPKLPLWTLNQSPETDKADGPERRRRDTLGGMNFLDLTLPTAAENVALDEALVVLADDGAIGSTLRIWELDHRAVVLGASGRIDQDVRRDACRADRVPVARRSSGGGTVLIGPGALNFTVVLPIAADPQLGAVDTAQMFILGRAAEALRVAGADVIVLGSGDLTLDSRKFAGSAQRRLKRHVMVHASLIYDVRADLIARYLHAPVRQPAYRQERSHEDFLTTLPLPRFEIVDALRSAWLGEGCHEGETLLKETSRLVSEKFGRADWIERL
jgi:lipoate-protein ligase A